jgi:hypothetical protein
LGYSPPRHTAVTDFPAQKIELIAEVNGQPGTLSSGGEDRCRYAPKMFPDLTGMEREFDPIKNFIWAGEGNAATSVHRVRA